SGAGAIVTYATCAKDIVDGDVTPDCGAHPPGSFFPFGDTLVKCSATDTHGNSASEPFTVSVGDTTPPVLTVPTVVTAIATSKDGAKVTYTVTAVDNIDPHPRVKCTPPSRSQLPLRKTPLTSPPTGAAGHPADHAGPVQHAGAQRLHQPPIRPYYAAHEIRPHVHTCSAIPV